MGVFLSVFFFFERDKNHIGVHYYQDVLLISDRAILFAVHKNKQTEFEADRYA